MGQYFWNPKCRNRNPSWGTDKLRKCTQPSPPIPPNNPILMWFLEDVHYIHKTKTDIKNQNFKLLWKLYIKNKEGNVVVFSRIFTVQVTNSIPVTILETPRVNLINHRFPPPFWRGNILKWRWKPIVCKDDEKDEGPINGRIQCHF